jgi:hypothetical protein
MEIEFPGLTPAPIVADDDLLFSPAVRVSKTAWLSTISGFQLASCQLPRSPVWIDDR